MRIRNKHLLKFLKSGLEQGFLYEPVQKAVFLNFFSIFTIASFLFFSITGFFSGQNIYASFLTILCILTAINLIYFHQTKNFKVSGHIITNIIFIISILIFAFWGESNSGFFWYYVFASFATFCVGRFAGVVYIIALLLLTGLICKISPQLIENYSNTFLIRFIFTFSISASFALFFEYLRDKSYKKFELLVSEKTCLLQQAQQQKEEILVQAEQLEKMNNELKKLSVVAQFTDNAVTIMDATGKFEWVNNSFTKIYGYSFHDFVEKVGSNLMDVSTNLMVREIIMECLSNKKSVTYESTTKSKTNQTIWLQTTLSPILDEYDNILKIISVESDITNIKQTQFELQEKNDEIIAQKDELTEKNLRIINQTENLRSSMKAAEMIQQAILPKKTSIEKYFDNFIIYLPKDIVSGDFYWFTSSNYVAAHDDNRGQGFLFMVATDCTGHGVPGAFMSMIGNQLLNDIINERMVFNPKKILTLMDIEIKRVLKNQKDTHEGMDVSLCRFENAENDSWKLIYSGAKQALLVYKTPTKELIELKGDRRSIGRVLQTKVDFTNQEIIIVPKDTIYLFTDGISDQNAPDRKRFGMSRLKKIIRQIEAQDLEEQEKSIIAEINQWSNGQPQRDDITLIGIKVKKNIPYETIQSSD